MVYGENSVFPKGFSEYPARQKCLKFNSDLFQEIVVRSVPLVAGISEKHCHLLFANKELGHIDSHGIFFGNDEKSINWCRDLIEYYWKIPSTQNHTFCEQ